MQCVLCGQLDATGTPTDHGNRTAICCPSEGCGSYEISKRAEADLLSNPNRSAALQQAVLDANRSGLRYEIFYESGEMVGRATSMKRS